LLEARRLEPRQLERDPGAAIGELLQRVGAPGASTAAGPDVLLDDPTRGSASTTSMEMTSFDPGALTLAVALAPTPARGPENSHLSIRWSVKASWLASTSRNA